MAGGFLMLFMLFLFKMARRFSHMNVMALREHSTIKKRKGFRGRIKESRCVVSRRYLKKKRKTGQYPDLRGRLLVNLSYWVFVNLVNIILSTTLFHLFFSVRASKL